MATVNRVAPITRLPTNQTTFTTTILRIPWKLVNRRVSLITAGYFNWPLYRVVYKLETETAR